MSNVSKRLFVFATTTIVFGVCIPSATAQRSGADNSPQQKTRTASDLAQRQLEQKRAQTDVQNSARRPVRTDVKIRQKQLAIDPVRAQPGRTLSIRIEEPLPVARPRDSDRRPAPRRGRKRLLTDQQPLHIPPVEPRVDPVDQGRLAGRRKKTSIDRPLFRRGRTNADEQARSTTRTDLTEGLSGLPDRFTAQDVQLYDNVFGQFNPLRQNAAPTDQRVPDRQRSLVGDAPRTDVREIRSRNQARDIRPVTERAGADLADKIQSAIRQRRTEISLIRDAAIEQVDLKRMQVADQMEATLNTFIRAQNLARKSASQATDSIRTRTDRQDIPRPAFPAASSGERQFRR